MSELPDIQLFLRPGIVEYGWGHPDMALLPADELAEAARHALERDGVNALAYGAEQGPGVLIEQLRARLASVEGAAPPADELLITGSVSQALDLLCTLLTHPGDVMLVEAPVYHLALKIFRDHGLDLVPVPADAQGIQVDALETILGDLRREGRRAPLLYTVPTFCNPSGALMPLERRRALVALAQRAGLMLLEDDVYRELWYDTPPSPPLYSLAAPGPVVRLSSFSKVLAPGLRLGWLLAPAPLVRRCVTGGLIDSGGGVNHFTAHVVAAYMALGLFDPHVEAIRGVYRRRRDTLVAALHRHLPAECRWPQPGGGFFVWIEAPEGIDTGRLAAQAEAAGVSYVPGARFYAGGGGEQPLAALI